jgi:hypothetical protein
MATDGRMALMSRPARKAPREQQLCILDGRMG